MVIENAIAEAIELFHMGALSAAVPMKGDIDLQRTLMAVSLDRVFALRRGDAHHDSRAATRFRNFIKATADIILDTVRIIVRTRRRAHNPFLLNAGFTDIDIRIPWLQNRRLNFQFV
ncbi:MAG: hypothetical protein OXC68_14295 [Aestuariivita sp.]|nr:hypothetical protein [Aestuariivita sp.]